MGTLYLRQLPGQRQRQQQGGIVKLLTERAEHPRDFGFSRTQLPRGCVDQQHHRLSRFHLQLPRQALTEDYMAVICRPQATALLNP